MIGWIVASVSCSGWRRMCLTARRAITSVSGHGGRAAAGRAGAAGGWWRAAARRCRPSGGFRAVRGWRWSAGRRRSGAPVSGQEDVVERRLAQARGPRPRCPPSSRALASSATAADAALGEGGDGALADVDRRLGAGHPRHDARSARRGRRRRTTITWSWSPPNSRFSRRASPRAITWPWSTTMMSSASRSASSRYWVVSRIVVALADEVVEDAPQLVAGARIEAGRGLVEEQDLRAGDERRGEVEPAAHPAGVRPSPASAGVRERELLEQLDRPRRAPACARGGAARRSSRGSRGR